MNPASNCDGASVIPGPHSGKDANALFLYLSFREERVSDHGSVSGEQSTSSLLQAPESAASLEAV
jgi:hypothetical protein